jgi:hypothetical protein
MAPTGTMLCPACGHPNTRADFKCSKCGTAYSKEKPTAGIDGHPIPQPCPGTLNACGAINPAKKLVCEDCDHVVNY